ncbi:hypothetical protein LUQ84_001538 [Hamiltosporidium tvaerminnensis]|nr:hypothetical protein LUQ84_001538 [Hamiltosporidium tvaerminnensis]
MLSLNHFLLLRNKKTGNKKKEICREDYYAFYLQTMKLIKDYIKYNDKTSYTPYETLLMFIEDRIDLNISNSCISAHEGTNVPNINEQKVDLNISKSYNSNNEEINVVKSKNDNKKIDYFNNERKAKDFYDFSSFKKNILIQNLKYLLLSHYNTDDQSFKRKLQKYHSYLCLIHLTLDENIPYPLKLSEWLSVNFFVENNNYRKMAIRGYFTQIISKYPDIKPVIESFFEIERFCSFGIKTDEYTEMMDKWKTKYEKNIPNNLKDILFGNLNTENITSIEKLCYKLFFVERKNGKFISKYEDMNHLIDDNDSDYILILKRDFDKLLYRLDGWLRLVLFFVCPMLPENIFNIFYSFEFIGNFLFSIDWKLSLEYLSFTKNFLKYFENYLKIVEVNLINFYFFISLCSRNKIDINIVYKYYINYYLNIGGYDEVFNIINDLKCDYIVDDSKFIDYCIKNYENIRNRFVSCEMLKKQPFWFISVIFNLKNNFYISENDIFMALKYASKRKWYEQIFKYLIKYDEIDKSVLAKSLCVIEEIKNDKTMMSDIFAFFSNKICEKLTKMYKKEVL